MLRGRHHASRGRSWLFSVSRFLSPSSSLTPHPRTFQAADCLCPVYSLRPVTFETRAPSQDLKAPDELLSRELGVRQLAAVIFNYTVGSGIFVLPAVVAAQLGSSAILAY